MRPAVVFTFTLLSLAAAKGQEALLPLDVYTSWKAERKMADSAVLVHPEVKPYTVWTVQHYTAGDTNRYEYHDLSLLKRDRSFFRISPRLSAIGFLETGDHSQRGVVSHVGVGIGAGWKNKVYLGAELLAGYTEPETYMQQITDSLRMVTGYGGANRQGPGYGFSQSTFTLAWKPSPYLELMAGRGKHFIGEGYRSMFLSDYASNYNYLRADVNVWKLKYTVLYTQMQRARGYPGAFYPLQNKYATMHYLSLNITHWWSVGAFEAVVWESGDSAVGREYDINYLNPVIFFRPVEYSIGSSDNSLLGFSTAVRPWRGLTFYVQLMLDEFVFDNATASLQEKLTGDTAIQTGWWANKQAFQLGVKCHEPLGWKNATVLGEFNFVRPFTYGHSRPAQAYTHLNQSLAHPLGANFIEWVAMAIWQPARWSLGLRATYSRKGYTNGAYFLGEDVLVSSEQRDKINRVFNNTMLQGQVQDVANMRLEAAYMLVPAWNLRAETAIHVRTQHSGNTGSVSTFFILGLRTALNNDYRDL